MSERFDAAVVGAGPNGLCAAIELARAGLSVVVLEAADTPGGGVRTQALTQPGFLHDVCSAIHPMAVASPLLRALDLPAHGLEWVQPHAPLAHPLDDGPAVMLERSVQATAQGLEGDAGRYEALMQPFVERWKELFGDALAPLGVPASPVLLARFGMHAFLPSTLLGKLAFRGPRARALLAGLAGHSVLPLNRAPSAAIGMMLGIAGHAVGWPTPRGGAGALTAALVSVLTSLGGVVRCGQRVIRLEQVPSDGPILFDTGPRALAAVAGDALPEGFKRRLLRYRYGPGVFKLDYALSGPIPWRDPAVARAGTVHLGGSAEELEASETACWQGQVSERPYVLVAQQSLFDDRRAPAGRHTGWAYCHVPAGCTTDMTAAIEDQLERFAPGFRDTVLQRHVTDPAGFERYNANNVGGDVNGGAPTLDQLFTRPLARPVPYSTPNPRLFICSASTPPGGGVHGMCGHFAAKAALRSLGLRAKALEG